VVSVGFSSEERFGVEVVRELLVEKDASLLYEQCDDSRGKGLFKQLLGVPVRLGVCESLLLFVGVPARKLSIPARFAESCMLKLSKLSWMLPIGRYCWPRRGVRRLLLNDLDDLLILLLMLSQDYEQREVAVVALARPWKTAHLFSAETIKYVGCRSGI